MPWLVNCRLRFCRRRRRNIAILLSLVSLLCAIAWGHFQLNRLDQLTISGDARYFTVKKGMSARSLVSELAGQPVSPFWTLVWLKLHPELAQIKMGTYRLESGWLVGGVDSNFAVFDYDSLAGIGNYALYNIFFASGRGVVVGIFKDDNLTSLGNIALIL